MWCWSVSTGMRKGCTRTREDPCASRALPFVLSSVIHARDLAHVACASFDSRTGRFFRSKRGTPWMMVIISPWKRSIRRVLSCFCRFPMPRSCSGFRPGVSLARHRNLLECECNLCHTCLWRIADLCRKSAIRHTHVQRRAFSSCDMSNTATAPTTIQSISFRFQRNRLKSSRVRAPCDHSPSARPSGWERFAGPGPPAQAILTGVN